jgi:glycosyltransferase involved in cell wall biosynthesis
MSGPSVSIIIPCYNTARYLGEALASSLAQDYWPVDITVIDDGSKDSSAQVAAGFPGVRCIRQANAGVSAARNNGLKQTSGEFVVFLDADDRLLPGAIATGVRELAAHPECGFVQGLTRGIDREGQVFSEPKGEPPPAGYKALLAGHSLVPPAAAMFRRSALDAVGGFNTSLSLAEDNDLYLRVASRFPVHGHAHAVVEYRLHEQNACRQSTARLLKAVLWTLEAQGPTIAGNAEFLEAARTGRRRWRSVFGPMLAGEAIENLKQGRIRPAARAAAALIRYYPRGILEYAGQRVGRLLGSKS